MMKILKHFFPLICMMALFPLHASGKAKGIPDFDYPKT